MTPVTPANHMMKMGKKMMMMMMMMMTDSSGAASISLNLSEQKKNYISAKAGRKKRLPVCVSLR